MLRAVAILAVLTPLFAEQSALTLEQKEEFLRNAKIIRTRSAKKGVTNTVRVTLSDGTLTHDASVQRIDEEKARFEGARGTEMNFRDSYKFNIAAYRLARLLGIAHMVPPSVERRYEGGTAAWTWWIDDVQIDEGERIRQKKESPDKDGWARQYHIMRIFDQLIANTDRNMQNILYDKGWHLWMIDHTRAFRVHTQVMEKQFLTRCDAQLLAYMKMMPEDKLRTEVGPWLRDREITGLLKRRDSIVKYFEKGDPKKLYQFLSEQ